MLQQRRGIFRELSRRFSVPRAFSQRDTPRLQNVYITSNTFFTAHRGLVFLFIIYTVLKCDSAAPQTTLQAEIRTRD